MLFVVLTVLLLLAVPDLNQGLSAVGLCAGFSSSSVLCDCPIDFEEIAAA